MLTLPHAFTDKQHVDLQLILVSWRQDAPESIFRTWNINEWIPLSPGAEKHSGTSQQYAPNSARQQCSSLTCRFLLFPHTLFLVSWKRKVMSCIHGDSLYFCIKYILRCLLCIIKLYTSHQGSSVQGVGRILLAL